MSLIYTSLRDIQLKSRRAKRPQANYSRNEGAHRDNFVINIFTDYLRFIYRETRAIITLDKIHFSVTTRKDIEYHCTRVAKLINCKHTFVNSRVHKI